MRVVIDTQHSLIVPPTAVPIDLEEVKKQRKVGSATTQDTLFDLWTNAAVQLFEEQTGRQLMLATWEYWLDCFPVHNQIEIPHPPLQEIVSIKYDDGDGVEQTLDSSAYRVINPQGDTCVRGRVALVTSASWPTTCDQPKAVRIRYTAGYGEAPGSVPELIRHCVLMLIGHFHKFNEEVQDGKSLSQVPLGARHIIEARKYTAYPVLRPLREWTGPDLYTGTTWPV